MKKNINTLNLSPIMHGDCWYIGNKLLDSGYAKKQIGIVLKNDESFRNYEYYEIDGKADVFFDANSIYGTIWFFPN